MEENYTEITAVGEGFIKKTRRNKIAPRDGSAPLTVIEFSLTNQVKDDLKKALLPYVEDNTTETTTSLRHIIDSHLPREVLEHLKQLNNGSEPPSTVYIIKNLPELDSHTIIAGKYSEYHLKTKSFSNFIGQGIGENMDLDRNNTFFLRRTSVDNEILGSGAMHKHPDKVTGLSGLYLSDKAQPATRFTDMGTLSEDALAIEDMKVRAYAKFEKPNDRGEVPISSYQQKWPHWKNAEEVKLIFKGNPQEVAQLICRHSQEVVVSAGDLVLWSNHGRIFHEALPAKETPYTPETVTRIVLGQIFNHRC